MPQRTVSIQAENERTARARAAQALDTSEDNVVLEETEEGEYRARPRNADASISIETTPDAMEAQVESVEGPAGDGSPLDEAVVRQALEAAGVKLGIDDEAIAQLLDKVAKEENVRGLVLARGEPPTQPEDGRIEVEGDLSRPVLPGMVICRRIAPKPARSGRTVLDEELRPPEGRPPREAAFRMGDGATPAEEEDCALATTYGLASAGPERVTVSPAFEVADDRLSVVGTIWSLDSHGDEITQERLEKTFARLGLVHGFDREAVEQALSREEAQQEGVQDVIFMQGDPPQDGADERLELQVSPQKTSGQEDETGRFDFRERGGIQGATAGEPIGRILPPEKGVPGRDVYDEALAAADGQPVAIQIGAGVQREDNGRLIATQDGVVLYTDNSLSVTDVLEIEGDVDYETGNIHIDKGSVRISGTIRAGFTVEATGSVLVGESVEGATVRAGGDMQVEQGVIMHGQGEIAVAGSLYAHFAENAIINAGGDVVVDNNVSNSRIVAHGRIVVTKGKGRIMGGTVHAGQGIEANEIGSHMHVATSLHLGFPTEEEERLRAERTEIAQRLERISRAIGDGEPRAVLERTPAPRRTAMARVIKTRREDQERLQRVDAILDKVRRERRKSEKAKLTVHGELHAGSRVSIAGAVLHVAESVGRCQVYYYPTRDSIHIGAFPT